MVRFASLALIAVAGCNQIFGLQDTKLIDGGAQSFVQVNAADSCDTSCTATQLQVALPQPVGAGNALILCIYTEGATVSAISDTLGDSFALLVGPTDDSSPPTGSLYIYGVFGVIGGMDTVTVTAAETLGIADILLYVHEYANIAGFDNGSSMLGQAGPGAMTSGPIAVHAANELMFGFGFADTAAIGSGFMSRSAFDNNITEDRLATAPSDQATAVDVSGRDWSMLGAAFRTR